VKHLGGSERVGVIDEQNGKSTEEDGVTSVGRGE